MFDLGIDLDLWPWIWLTIAVVFALLELTLIAGTFVLAPFAVSAFAASLLGFAGVSADLQWAVFVIGGVALFALAYRWAKRFVAERDLPPGVGAERLVGMQGTVTTDIPPRSAPSSGAVAVEGETWRAVSDGAPMVAGTLVEVIAVRGTRVVVRAAADVYQGGPG